MSEKMLEVLLEHPEPAIAVIKLNRPEARNALNGEIRRLLAEYFTALGDDPQIRAIVLTGGNTCFTAGADVKEMAGRDPIGAMLLRSQRIWQVIADCPKPVIAAVNGYAWGAGCELAMHADIIVAGENASFCQPEVKVGLMPGSGGTQRLMRAVGKFRAMKMLLTGQPVKGREALEMGLASEVVSDDKVQERALELAREISALPPLAIAQIKEVSLAGQDASLATALMLERKAFHLLFASEDQKEGARAFKEKRKPVFQGK